MKFIEYKHYKYSGDIHLGKIPDHWKVLRLGYLTEKIGSGKTPSGGAESYCNDGIIFLRSQNVYDDGLFLDEVAYIDKSIDEDMKNTRVRGNDILLNLTGASLGRTCIVPLEFPQANVNQHVCIIRLKDKKQCEFIAFVLKSAFIKTKIDLAQNGAAREGLNFDQVSKLLVPIPQETGEMVKIVDFLTVQSSRMKSLIEEQENLITLLREKRQAIISIAISKGMDQCVSMKNSGTDWLGEVPSHWECCRAKRIFQEVDERSIDGSEELLTVSHLTGVTPRSEKNVNMFLAETMEGYKLCRESDFVINTMWAWMGAMGIAPIPGLVSPAYNIYRQKEKKFHNKYFEFLCRTPEFTTIVKSRSTGIWESRLRLYPDEFFSIILPVPPLCEQQEIIEWLDSKIDGIDNLIGDAESCIALMQEHLIALISDVVTGKVDVREVACV